MPPASAHQCHINATLQCLPIHINATYQCPSELPIQCHPSVPPISAANHCHLSCQSAVSAAYQCASV
ncbi:unnamed protein product, partial [Staurois parvus]